MKKNILISLFSLILFKCDDPASSSDEAPDILGSWYMYEREYYGNSICSGDPYDSFGEEVECEYFGYYFDEYECYRSYLTFYANSTYSVENQYCPTEDFSDPDCVFESDYYGYDDDDYYTISNDNNPITGYSLIVEEDYADYNFYLPIEVFSENNERRLSYHGQIDTTEYFNDDYQHQNGWWNDNTNQCAKVTLKESSIPLNDSRYNNRGNKNKRFKKNPFKILIPNNETTK